MEIIVLVLIGVLLGAALTLYLTLIDISGTLQIKTDQDEVDYLFLELSKKVPKIINGKYVLFKVAPRE
jgi:hypothetical protein